MKIAPTNFPIVVLLIVIVWGSIGCSYESHSAILTGEKQSGSTVSTPPALETEKATDEHWNTVRNDVSGIAIGSTFTEVVGQFGRPNLIKKGGTNPCGGNKSIFRYSGIVFTLDEDESKRNIVVVIEITSPKWKIAPGIRTGFTVAEVRAKMGRLGNMVNEKRSELLEYGDGDGYINFYFTDGKLVKIVRDLNQC